MFLNDFLISKPCEFILTSLSPTGTSDFFIIFNSPKNLDNSNHISSGVNTEPILKIFEYWILN